MLSWHYEKRLEELFKTIDELIERNVELQKQLKKTIFDKAVLNTQGDKK